jgi:hypothetical protein
MNGAIILSLDYFLDNLVFTKSTFTDFNNNIYFGIFLVLILSLREFQVI